MKFTKEMTNKNAFIIDLHPSLWTVIEGETIGFYSVVGKISQYWLNCLLGYLDKRIGE